MFLDVLGIILEFKKIYIIIQDGLLNMVIMMKFGLLDMLHHYILEQSLHLL